MAGYYNQSALRAGPFPAVASGTGYFLAIYLPGVRCLADKALRVLVSDEVLNPQHDRHPKNDSHQRHYHDC